MELFDITKYKTKKELFEFIVTNKEQLIAAKKAVTKHSDGINYAAESNVIATKGQSDNDNLQVKAVINTTNLMDSHNDVHLPGLWNKSLKENRSIMHLQEHEMKFDKIIAKGNDLKASVKTYSWKELGYNFAGNTQALIFDSTVKRSRNAFMYDEYKSGDVDNHSVGMQYVKILLAVNDEDYGAEYEAWEKYYPEIANKEQADSTGYFWAVKEAKVIEGSAVPLGSNFATPTLEVKEPPEGTHEPIEPPDGTQLSVKEFKNILKELL